MAAMVNDDTPIPVQSVLRELGMKTAQLAFANEQLAFRDQVIAQLRGQIDALTPVAQADAAAVDAVVATADQDQPKEEGARA